MERRIDQTQQPFNSIYGNPLVPLLKVKGFPCLTVSGKYSCNNRKIAYSSYNLKTVAGKPTYYRPAVVFLCFLNMGQK